MPSRTPPVDFETLEARRVVSVPRLVHDVFDVCRDRVLAQLRSAGHTRVGMSHSVVLRHLDFAGTPLSVITRRAGVSRQAIAKVAAQLQDLGYARTVSDARDRRIRVLKLTRKGMRLVTDALDAYDSVEREFAERIGRRRLEDLRSTLQQITATVGAAQGDAGISTDGSPA